MEWAFGELWASSLVLSWRTMVSSSGGFHTHLGATILLVAWSSNHSSIFMSILFSFLSSLSIILVVLCSWTCFGSAIPFSSNYFLFVLKSVRFFCLSFNFCSVSSFPFPLLIQFDNIWFIQMSLGFGTCYWWVLDLEPWSNF